MFADGRGFAPFGGAPQASPLRPAGAAQQQFSSSSSSSNTDWEKLKLEGNNNFGAGRYQEAVVCYTRAIQRNPEESKLFSNRALCHLKLSDFAACEMDATKASELDGNNPKAWYLRGRCQYRNSRWETAVRYFKRGMDICCLIGDSELSSQLYGDLFNAYFVARKALYEFDHAKKASVVRHSVEDCKELLQDSSASPLTRGKVDQSLAVLEQLYIIATDMHATTSEESVSRENHTANSSSSSEALRHPVEIPECFICPISLDVMRDPVILAKSKSGFQTFDRVSLKQHFLYSNNDPISHEPIRPEEFPDVLVPNKSLRNAIILYLESHPYLYKGSLES